MEGEERELLVISGRRDLVGTLRHQWSRQGLAVRHLVQNRSPLDEARLEQAALVVVDLESSEAGGMELCDRLGAKRAVRFIVLLPGPDPYLATAVLDRGADDCLAWPVSPQELFLRIQAILRRTASSGRR